MSVEITNALVNISCAFAFIMVVQALYTKLDGYLKKRSHGRSVFIDPKKVWPR